MLTGPDDLIILYMLHNDTQDDLLPSFIISVENCLVNLHSYFL